MARKKLAKVQDIPGMKIYDGPDGPEMYATDKRGGWPYLYWEAKRICHKVRITYIESPESEPQTLIIAPYKLESSVDGWAVGDLPSEGFECKMYSLANITAAEIIDETFIDPYADPEYFVAELNYFSAKRRSATNTLKDNINKISLNELGLGDDVDKRIWEAMLPQMRKHLGGESSIFDGIQFRRQFDAYSEAGNALLESAVIDPCLDEYWELNEKGAYTVEWTENDVREFKEKMKARWSYMMRIAYRAMNGTLSEDLTFKSTLGTTWEKILDETWVRDFKLVRMLCGDLDDTVSARGEDSDHEVDIKPDLPF